jgi:hypothetical protein
MSDTPFETPDGIDLSGSDLPPLPSPTPKATDDPFSLDDPLDGTPFETDIDAVSDEFEEPEPAPYQPPLDPTPEPETPEPETPEPETPEPRRPLAPGGLASIPVRVPETQLSTDPRIITTNDTASLEPDKGETLEAVSATSRLPKGLILVGVLGVVAIGSLFLFFSSSDESIPEPIVDEIPIADVDLWSAEDLTQATGVSQSPLDSRVPIHLPANLVLTAHIPYAQDLTGTLQGLTQQFPALFKPVQSFSSTYLTTSMKGAWLFIITQRGPAFIPMEGQTLPIPSSAALQEFTYDGHIYYATHEVMQGSGVLFIPPFSAHYSLKVNWDVSKTHVDLLSQFSHPLNPLGSAETITFALQGNHISGLSAEIVAEGDFDGPNWRALQPTLGFTFQPHNQNHKFVTGVNGNVGLILSSLWGPLVERLTYLDVPAMQDLLTSFETAKGRSLLTTISNGLTSNATLSLSTESQDALREGQLSLSSPSPSKTTKGLAFFLAGGTPNSPVPMSTGYVIPVTPVDLSVTAIGSRVILSSPSAPVSVTSQAITYPWSQVNTACAAALTLPSYTLYLWASAPTPDSWTLNLHIR